MQSTPDQAAHSRFDPHPDRPEDGVDFRRTAEWLRTVEGITRHAAVCRLRRVSDDEYAACVASSAAWWAEEGPRRKRIADERRRLNEQLEQAVLKAQAEANTIPQRPRARGAAAAEGGTPSEDKAED